MNTINFICGYTTVVLQNCLIETRTALHLQYIAITSQLAEVDSLLLLNCTIDVWAISWGIENKVKEIKIWLSYMIYFYLTLLQEANKVADKLASLSDSLTHVQVYSHFNTSLELSKGFLT